MQNSLFGKKKPTRCIRKDLYIAEIGAKARKIYSDMLTTFTNWANFVIFVENTIASTLNMGAIALVTV